MKVIPEEAWFLRGDRGLTFARDLPEGSRITAGEWWPANYGGPPLVSIDERAATATGLKIGDRLTISVLGVEIEARIASFREINWDTLGFNFVLVFSPGALEMAPYTLAATVGATASAEPAISRAVSDGFPAVSMIRVKDVVTQVGDLMRQLGSAIAISASVAVLAGIAVLMGAVAAARRSRSYDAVLLKLLGATRRQVLGVQAIEYASLSFILSIVALIIGGAAGWYAVTAIFDLEFAPDWSVVLGTVALGGIGTLVLGLLGTLPVLAARPAAALREL
jgi:putative ABC transport system permease protein